MKIFIYSILLPILFLSYSLDAQMRTAFEAKAKQGKQLQRAGQYDQALRIFQQGYREARLAEDKEWEGKFLFYHGNTYLLQAESEQSIGGRPSAGSNGSFGDGSSYSSDDSSVKEALAYRAITVFKQVVNQLPESGSSKIKLADAYALVGQDEDANVWYEKAISQNDNKQTLYRMQYAAFLQQRNSEQAVKQLRLVLKAQPENTKAQRQLLDIYSSPKYASSLRKYLLQQIDAGQVIAAQDATLTALQNSAWSENDKSRLMPLLALSLSKQHIPSDKFTNSKTAEVLEQIAKTEPTLADCIKELNGTMASARPINYRWWKENRTRASAISDLMRSRARYYDQAGKTREARNLYSGAADLVGEKDPTAVMDLVDFYSKQGDINGINRVSKKYEYALFRGKGEAYSEGKVDKIYDYHRTLASIYSFQAKKTGDWGSSSKTNSATFQLQRAYATAERSKKIIPDTRLVTNLATSYEKKGQAKKANNVRIDAAALYKKTGRASAATTVLKDVKVNKLNQAELRRYDRVRVSPVLVNPDVGSTLKPVKPGFEVPKGRSNVSTGGAKNIIGNPKLNVTKPISTYKPSSTLKAIPNSNAIKATNSKAILRSQQKVQLPNSSATKSTASKSTASKSVQTKTVQPIKAQQYKLQQYKIQTLPDKDEKSAEK